MSERTRIMIVLLSVVCFNVIDQLLLRSRRGITDTSFYFSLVVALIVYALLVIFFRRKKKSDFYS